MRRTWRRWLSGPKHGIARGVVVYGSAGFRDDPDRLASHLRECRGLRAWADRHRIALDDQPSSLPELDRALDRRRAEAGRLLEIDAGLYLGTVLVRSLPRAHWHVWPNGHPVVQLESGRTLDVVALAHGQVSTGQQNLAALYADLAQDAAH